MVQKRLEQNKFYLKVLGWLTIVMAIGGIITSIVVWTSPELKLQDLILGNEYTSLIREHGEAFARAAYGIGTILAMCVGLLSGWLLLRASKHPEKTTFLFILTVVTIISNGIAVMRSDASFSILVSTGANLIVDVLSLAVIWNVKYAPEE